MSEHGLLKKDALIGVEKYWKLGVGVGVGRFISDTATL